MMTGQFGEASRAADALVATATPALAQMPMLEPFAAKKIYVLLRFAKWSDALLWQSLVAQGRTAEANRAERDFTAEWTRADVELKIGDL
jgi:hypothetical protein